MIVVLIGFVLFQAYEFSYDPAVGLAVLTIFDIAVIALTAREYRLQRRHRRAHDTATDDSRENQRAAGDRPPARLVSTSS